MLGLQELALPIPGTGCPLRNEALIARPMTADGQGVARLTISLPAGFAGQFVAQHLAATPNGGWFDWHSSNGIRVRLP